MAKSEYSNILRSTVSNYTKNIRSVLINRLKRKGHINSQEFNNFGDKVVSVSWKDWMKRSK